VFTELREKLCGGTKGLIGNSAYRKYVTVEKDAVSIDERKIAAEQRYDGKYVLLTNTDLSPRETALAHKELWQVVRAFRETLSAYSLDTTLTSLKEVRMVELEIAGKGCRVLPVVPG
jgi:hypothetical protein